MRQAGRPSLLSRPQRNLFPGAAREADTLEPFFRTIRDTPVLTAEQEVALARTMAAARDGLMEALGSIPGATGRLLEAWDRRCAEGRVPARLQESRGSKADRSDQLERHIDEMRKCFRAAAATDGRSPDPGNRERELSRLFRAFDARTDLLLAWLGEVEASAARSAGYVRRHEQLAPGRLRARLREASAHRAAYLEARDSFVQHNLRLVVHMAKDQRRSDIPFADLIQEGVVGLVRAVEKFDPDRGFRFSTYAAWWIYQAFIRGVQRDSRTVRLPAHVHGNLIKLRKAEDQLRSELGRAATRHEIAAAMHWTAQEIDELRAARLTSASLDTPASEEVERPILETLTDPEAAQAFEGRDAHLLCERVQALVEELPDRERFVVTARFGLGDDDPHTLQRLAEDMGLSRERVRQIEKRALQRMTRPATQGRLRDFLDAGQGMGGEAA
jgi:RNA polymerase sigma factor (sigma-70 family)